MRDLLQRAVTGQAQMPPLGPIGVQLRNVGAVMDRVFAEAAVPAAV